MEGMLLTLLLFINICQLMDSIMLFADFLTIFFNFLNSVNTITSNYFPFGRNERTTKNMESVPQTSP